MVRSPNCDGREFHPGIVIIIGDPVVHVDRLVQIDFILSVSVQNDIAIPIGDGPDLYLAAFRKYAIPDLQRLDFIRVITFRHKDCDVEHTVSAGIDLRIESDGHKIVRINLACQCGHNRAFS